MEFIVVLILLFFVLPIVLSIVAMVKVGNLREEFNALKHELARAVAPPPPTPVRTPVPEAPAPAPAPPARPPSIPTPPPVQPPQPVAPRSPKAVNEVALGGKVASFAGIALLLIGVAFLIGYAIKNAWLGPAARIVLGMLCGAGMVLIGHLAEVRGKGRLHLLARTLTGGGTAIFYLCVFAAHALYDLIGMTAAGVGLVACAAAALGLATAYRSHVVGVIGVVGAFLMPALIGEDVENRAFLMVYIAVINLPVIALGIYRNWQGLYNTAFGFTAIYVLALLADLRQADSTMLLIFSLVYFFEFAALGLLKLRQERQTNGRNLDIVRLILNSLGLLGGLYVIMDFMELDQWTGAAMLAMAVAHIGLARVAWTWLPAFKLDMLALLVGALTFASLALPIQLDGAWVSAGWSIEGAILCWFALRARVQLLKTAAFLLGAIGLMKSLMFDIASYATAPALFLNARFATGILSAALLGLQGWLHGRMTPKEQDEPESAWTRLSSLAALALLVVFTTDLFWTLGSRHPWAWLLSSLALIAIAGGCAMLARSQPSLAGLAVGLLLLAPIKLVVDLFALSDIGRPAEQMLFLNGPFAALAIMMLFLIWVSGALFRHGAFPVDWGGVRPAVTLNIGALLAAILIVTSELYRMASAWNQMLVTLWWASCAIALVIEGLIRRNRSHRYAGLALFAVTTGKVLLVDLSALDGLERIAAFMSAGVLLLVLSFIYQRAAARLTGEEQP